MNISIKYLIISFIVFSSIFVKAQNAIVVSSSTPATLRIAMNWAPNTSAVAYKIYRKNLVDSNYPSTPIATVSPISNCFSIRNLLITGSDSTQWKIVSKALSESTLFNPCDVNTISKTSEKYNRLSLLSRRNMAIAKTIGLGFEDYSVLLGEKYAYKIVAVNSVGVNIETVGTDLNVTAGSFSPLPAPNLVIAEGGDASVLVRWANVQYACGYVLERSFNPINSFVRVNPSKYSTQISNHINGTVLNPSMEGMYDFQLYNNLGSPIPKIVNGVNINGPINGKNYYYRVRSLDLFDRPGLPSNISNIVTPKDSTAPTVPNDLMVTSDDVQGSINIRWSQVKTDINGHLELNVPFIKYSIYRFESSENPNTTPNVLIGEVSTLNNQKSNDTTDKSLLLRPMFGNKTWWYRIRTIDASKNVSNWSSAVSALIKDINPPEIVKGVKTNGLEESIQVSWAANNEPDISSYKIYRSLCHLGKWVDCAEAKECKDWQTYNPHPEAKVPEGKRDGEKEEERGKSKASRNNILPCPCSGSFVFLGEVSHDSVLRAEQKGNWFFIDKTIPKGSPLCYAYWIKAVDSSANMSGVFPIPSVDERTQIVCQRLKDRTPPDAAIISGLHARDQSIRVEWMGPPSQDIRAYHVYRAQGRYPGKIPDNREFRWVGGETVEIPPSLPVRLSSPYTPPNLSACESVSVQATPWMSQGYFEDKSVEDKITYWYKVVGIDYDGNESKLENAAAISTFTFSRKIENAPKLDLVVAASDPCSVVLQWTPNFIPDEHLGFVIYRSTTATGKLIPIVDIPTLENRFNDKTVVHGETYWYSVGTLMKNGRLSKLSAAQSITP